MRTIAIMLGLTAALSVASDTQRDERGAEVRALWLSFGPLIETPTAPWALRAGVDGADLPGFERGGAGATIVADGYGVLDPGAVRANAEMFSTPTDPLKALGLRVDRSTALRDGGIDSASGSIRAEPLPGYAEPNGEFDLYDISVRVGQLGGQDLGLSFLTGFRAIRADVGRVSVSQDRAGNTTTTYHEGVGIVAVPVVGTGVHWNPSERVKFRGGATTHTISDATFFDLRAEAEIRLRYNVGLTAGYEFVRSMMEVRHIEAELSESGLFARLQIKF